MLEWTVGCCCLGKLLSNAVKDHLVGVWIVDLVTSTLRAGINAEEANAGSEAGDDGTRVLGDVWTWVAADDVGWMLLLILQDVDIASLLWVLSDTITVVVHGLWRIGGVRGDWWRKVVLKEKVVLVGSSTDATEDIAFHEVIDVRAEAVNDVVVIPQVERRNLSVHASEWLGIVPADVVGQVVVVTLLSEPFWKRILAALARVRDLSPWSEWSVDTNAVVIDLITTAEPVSRLVFSSYLAVLNLLT